MVEIYESKKDSVRCEFVHPQTLDEIHAEIAKNRSAKEQSLPEIAPKEPDKPTKPDFEIYQLKRGMENHDIRFVTLEELAARGEKPDFSRYEKMYTLSEYSRIFFLVVQLSLNFSPVKEYVFMMK